MVRCYSNESSVLLGNCHQGRIEKRWHASFNAHNKNSFQLVTTRAWEQDALSWWKINETAYSEGTTNGLDISYVPHNAHNHQTTGGKKERAFLLLPPRPADLSCYIPFCTASTTTPSRPFKSCRKDGMLPRVHGNTRRLPSNAPIFNDVKHVVSFIDNTPFSYWSQSWVQEIQSAAPALLHHQEICVERIL